MCRRRHFLGLSVAGLACSQATAQVGAQPEVWWWYWDRPAHLLPWPAPGVGAAVVVTHALLSGQAVRLQPRRNALPLPPGTVAMPVVHVEVDPARALAGTRAQRDALCDALVEAVRRSSLGWVQLDFEARPSQRSFWRAVVDATHAALRPGERLSVTALASWCHGDRWLGDAPVDEVVPMYFRLGHARRGLERLSAAGVSEQACGHAHGLADDEPPWPVPLAGRRYLFLGRVQRGPFLTPLNGSDP